MESRESICKFKVPKNSFSASPILIVNFSNGRLKLSNSSYLKFTCYRHEEDKTDDSKARRILVANNGRLNYEGTSFENNHDPIKSSFRYCVGVRDKKTGRMKLYECILIHLKPVMREKNIYDVKSDIISDKSYRDDLDVLTLNFGSKGKKRVVNARLKYSVDSSPLADALEDIKLSESSPLKQNNAPSTSFAPSRVIDYLPPRNYEAQAPSEVYNICDIISDEEDGNLFELAEVLLQEYSTHFDDWKKNGTYCKYVLAHLEKNRDLEKVKYLIYYNYLVMFSKLTYKEINKKDPISEIGEPFKSKLLEYYAVTSCTEKGKIVRNLPQRIKDKLAAYLFVLALIIDDYCVNIPSVISDLKYGIPSMCTIAQAVGCHVVSRKVKNSSEKFAELKLPLFVLSKFSKK